MRRLGELSEIVGGHLTAQPDLKITGAASISRAQPMDITFVTSRSRFDDFLASDAAAAVVCIGLDLPETKKPCLLVEDVTGAFVEIAELFRPPVARTKIGISPEAIVSPTAIICDDVCIHPGAVIMDNVEIGFGSVIYPNVTVMENCVIGAHAQVFPNAVLYENTVVGDRSIIHAGAVLGAFGFGYKSNSGRHILCAQIGNVVVGDEVEIGANTTIDRGTYDSTTIGSGTKIDNLVMIGHNCVIGDQNLVCSQVGIAGSCTVGDYTVMGGQVGIGDHLNIGSHVAIAARSGLMHDLTDNQRVLGAPARPAREAMQIFASQAKLPELLRTVKKMERRLDDVTVQREQQRDSRAA